MTADLDSLYADGELGRYYRRYEHLMERWRHVLAPGSILEVHYEDVVNAVEAQAKRIVAYCGLEWDDACLAFYASGRPVRTASSAQVRRPIYRTSVGYAREYEDFLGPLVSELNRDREGV